MSGPDNSGAEAIVRDYHPQHLVCPAAAHPFALGKNDAGNDEASRVTMPNRGGRDRVSSSGPAFVSMCSIPPPTARKATRMIAPWCCFSMRATGRFFGRAGSAPPRSGSLLETYPGLRADLLVMGTEAPPDDAWLRSLQVRDWLQVPPRDLRSNATNAVTVPDFCQVWPLNQTGAVEIHFQPAQASQPPQILLRPWRALPARP